MEIIRSKIGKKVLADSYCSYFGSMTKAVVDVEREIMAVDAELHSDQEALLLEEGSRQEDLWGVNLYPEKSKEDCIEFTSLINIRPHQGNFSQEVEDPLLRERIRTVVFKLVAYES
jgi:hypothetical protein